ncbi:GntR family transcriptional regulator [Leifsonia shinshuensis]|uniref:DNA-binding transcriptional MocR family regulator n=1 Tax=Leifsonia shinshuensis TaxID=150026 RepID=A0A853D2D1_9MICO|nr:GntR family transcriptional regulator [Leifsonia shinshuensis]NYJ25601.1 DNA-binding transcriptional MocR family regulator [Leifsonia shinshuensis]
MSEYGAATAAFEDLAGAILSGTRAPNSRLPTSRELARKSGIAIGTANKALGMAVEMGLAIDSGRERHVAPVTAGTRELRPAVRSLIDDALRNATDLETLVLLIRGLWEQKNLRANESFEDDRYAELVPAEFVLGGAPEPEHTDEVTSDDMPF